LGQRRAGLTKEIDLGIVGYLLQKTRVKRGPHGVSTTIP
jgi:hypothetical protein